MSNIPAEQLEALNKQYQKIIADTLNLSDDEIASLAFNEDGQAQENFGSVITDKFKSHITQVRDSAATKFDDGYKKAQSELMSKLEKEFNSKFEFDGDGKLLDRVQTVLDLKVKKAIEGIEGKELTDAEIENHPKYKSISQALIDQKNGYEQKLGDLEKTYQSAQTKAQVKIIAGNMIDQLNPIFNKDATKARNQRADLINRIANGNWKIENGSLVPVNEDGTIQRNEMEHPISGQDLVKGVVTSYYDLNVQGGNPPIDGGGSQGSQGSSTGFKDIDTSKKLVKKLDELYKRERECNGIKDEDERNRQRELIGKQIEALDAHGKKLDL